MSEKLVDRDREVTTYVEGGVKVGERREKGGDGAFMPMLRLMITHGRSVYVASSYL